jgi:predicted RNA-binding Zn-ribbon protein involved in translation (DUF1610 family)
MTMDKFGVDEGIPQENLEKQAAQGCPNCGRKDVIKHGATLICPSCGSEPFEQGQRERKK